GTDQPALTQIGKCLPRGHLGDAELSAQGQNAGKLRARWVHARVDAPLDLGGNLSPLRAGRVQFHMINAPRCGEMRLDIASCSKVRTDQRRSRTPEGPRCSGTTRAAGGLAARTPPRRAGEGTRGAVRMPDRLDRGGAGGAWSGV